MGSQELLIGKFNETKKDTENNEMNPDGIPENDGSESCQKLKKNCKQLLELHFPQSDKKQRDKIVNTMCDAKKLVFMQQIKIQKLKRERDQIRL